MKVIVECKNGERRELHLEFGLNPKETVTALNGAYYGDTGTIAPTAPEKTLRDEFAMAALTGLESHGPHDCDAAGIAHDAYLYADEMLKARKGGE